MLLNNLCETKTKMNKQVAPLQAKYIIRIPGCDWCCHLLYTYKLQ